MITPAQARAHLADEIDHFVALLGATDVAAPVPSCPGWTVRDLAVHLGNVHRWVIQAITSGDSADPLPAEVPDQALTRWYRGIADDLLALFAATDPDAPCWTFGMEPRQAGFWFRRQAHEVGVHRWDLGAAGGNDVGYDQDLAADGIDEVATMFFPRQVRLGRIQPLTAGLALEPDDSALRWVITGDGTEPATDSRDPDATVSGPAAGLLLLLWGRLDLDDDRIRLTGSTAAARAVLGGSIVP